MKSYRVTINDRTYNVEIEDVHAAPVRATVDGEPYEVAIEEPHDQSIRPSRETPSVTQTPAQAARSEQSITAPMPGTILSVRVAAGARVTREQELCILEAMKMKNSIKSPRDGVIANVGITEGQTVAHGDMLFEFE